MTRQTLAAADERPRDQGAHARIIDVAIEQFGQHGFDAELSAIVEAASVNAVQPIGEFGSAEGLRKACDD